MTSNAKKTGSSSRLRKPLNKVLVQRVYAAEEARKNLEELFDGDSPLNSKTLASMDRDKRDTIRKWIRDWQVGQEARQMLFANNQPLVTYHVEKRVAKQLTTDEMTEVGKFGLLKAIQGIGQDKFDSQKGEFGAYASNTIDHELTSAVYEVQFADQHGRAKPLREYREAEKERFLVEQAATPAFTDGRGLTLDDIDEKWLDAHSKGYEGELSFIANKMGKSSSEAGVLRQYSKESAILNQGLKDSESKSTLEDFTPESSADVLDAGHADATSSLEQARDWLSDVDSDGYLYVQLLDDLLAKRDLRKESVTPQERPEHLFLNDKEFAEIVEEHVIAYYGYDPEEPNLDDFEEAKKGLESMLVKALARLRERLEEQGFTKESLFKTK